MQYEMGKSRVVGRLGLSIKAGVFFKKWFLKLHLKMNKLTGTDPQENISLNSPAVIKF